MSAVPFSRWWKDPVLVVDEIRSMHDRIEAEEKRLKEQDRRRKARRIRKLTKLAKAGKLKGVVNGK